MAQIDLKSGAFQGSIVPATLTADRTYTLPDTDAALGGLFSSYAILADVKSNGVAGGGLTNGAWRHRDLNTEIADPDSIVSISSNTFVLGAGSYMVEWACAVQSTARSQTRLYDVTGSAIVTNGSGMNVYSNGIPWGVTRVTPSGSTTYRIEHQVETTIGTYGAGGGTSYGDVEVFTIVKIYKEY